MNIRRLADRVRDTIARRGGTGALKEDAQELRDIAQGRGRMRDKVKEGVEAVKEPGAPGEEPRRHPEGERSTTKPPGR